MAHGPTGRPRRRGRRAGREGGQPRRRARTTRPTPSPCWSHYLTFGEMAGARPLQPAAVRLRQDLDPRQVRAARALRRRAVRRGMGRRGASRGLLPLQDGLQGAVGLAELPERPLERGHELADRLRPPLHRAAPSRSSGRHDDARSTAGCPNVPGFGADTTAEKVGLAAVAAVAGASAGARRRQGDPGPCRARNARRAGAARHPAAPEAACGSRLTRSPASRATSASRRRSADGRVTNAWSPSTMFRGIEIILRGSRPARRVGLRAAHLRRLHDGARDRLDARGRERDRRDAAAQRASCCAT